MPPGSAFLFGPFRLDPQTRRLARDGTLVKLPPSHFNLLHAFVSHVDVVLTKDQLLQAAWPGIAATDNSLAQGIVALRQLLDEAKAPCTIVNERGFGYRMTGQVQREASRLSGTDLDALLAPHRSFTEGRAALESLDRERIAAARHTFAQLLRTHADDAMLHVGLANACALTFEATRAEATPDADALGTAERHAREACGLNHDYGEAWATLGFVLDRTGRHADAVAALQRAVRLEPDHWRHWLRLAYATWGEERLRAATRTLTLLPGCPMARLLSATVFVARDAPALAEREIEAGLAAVAAEADGAERFSSVALHWLYGLLALARGDDDEAVAAFERELALEARGHLYARECSANAWYAIGVCRFRRADRAKAQAAFREAIARVPRHPMAHAGLVLLGEPIDRAAATVAPMSVDVAMAHAVIRVAAGDPSGGAQLVATALASAPSGSAGWLVPAEPLLCVSRDRAVWAPVLALLRTRAS